MNYVVTGTSRGIGLEMTTQLLAGGHVVHAVARTPEKSKGLNELKEKYHDKLKIYSADVTSDKQVSAFAEKLGDTVVDVLINNAGIYGENGDFENLDLADVEKTFSNNAVAPMRVTRALLPHLKKSAHPKVLHVTSLMGSIEDNTGGGSYGYRMSKTALNMFHKSFTNDYKKITSIVIHPGWVKTDMGGSAAPTLPKDSASGILKVIQGVTLKDSGKFFDFEGDPIPW